MEEDPLIRNKDESDSEDQKMNSALHHFYRPPLPIYMASVIIFAMLLPLSVGGNIFQYWHYSRNNGDRCRSQVAGVTGGVTRTFEINTDWSSRNASQADQLWKGLAPNVGMVAVENTLSREMDLYSTETFPWDSNKGIYMLEGYHSLHCLKMYIYRALREFQQGLQQSTPMRHHIHCLDALRENTICAADDTLRPAGSDMGKPQNPGRRPHKQCRNWDQLEKWALQNSACFKRFPDGDPKHKTLEEWKWCPDESPYIPTIDMFFGREE